MKSETLFTLGAIAAGGYLVYKIAPEIVKTLKPAEQVTGAVGNVAESAGGAVSSWLDLVNIRKINENIENRTNKTLEQTQKELSTPKYIEGKGIGIFDTTGTYGIGASLSSSQARSTQDFNNTITKSNVTKLLNNAQTKTIYTSQISQKEKEAINKAYSIFGVKTKVY